MESYLLEVLVCIAGSRREDEKRPSCSEVPCRVCFAFTFPQWFTPLLKGNNSWCIILLKYQRGFILTPVLTSPSYCLLVSRDDYDDLAAAKERGQQQKHRLIIIDCFCLHCFIAVITGPDRGGGSEGSDFLTRRLLKLRIRIASPFYRRPVTPQEPPLTPPNIPDVLVFPAAVVVCCQTWPTPCMFHRTHPCRVSVLRAPLAHQSQLQMAMQGVECGNWGPPRQMGSGFLSFQMFVSEQWYGFMLMSFKRHLQRNQTARLGFAA